MQPVTDDEKGARDHARFMHVPMPWGTPAVKRDGELFSAGWDACRKYMRELESRPPHGSQRGSPEHPCEGCKQTTKGNTLSEGWFRCNACDHPWYPSK